MRGKGSMIYKSRVIEFLYERAELYKKEKDKFRERAYKKAVESIEKIPKNTLVPNDLENVPGVGVRIKEKIINLNSETDSTTSKPLSYRLRNIHGIGPVKAKQLENIGLNMSNLHQNLHLLTPAQKIGLKYEKEFQDPIPRKEMKDYDMILSKAANKIGLHITLVGSYRRGKESSGDVDALVTANHDLESKFVSLVHLLQNMNYISDVMAFGKRKFMGVINDKRRLDLLAVPPSKYPFALLYFTGSKEFNINMRKRALQKGMSLSEHGLKGNNQSIQSEEDVFKVLDMEYLPPEKRLS